MGKKMVKAAFATDDLERVDAEFGKAKHFLVFTVTPESSVLERTLDFRGGEGGGMDSPRVQALKGCAMLFVPKPVEGVEVLGLIRSQIFVTKLPGKEPIASVILRLQETLRRGVYPRWLRKAMDELPEEPAAAAGGEMA